MNKKCNIAASCTLYLLSGHTYNTIRKCNKRKVNICLFQRVQINKGYVGNVSIAYIIQRKIHKMIRDTKRDLLMQIIAHNV